MPAAHYLARLNPEQRHAVEHGDPSPLLIIAGAGTGKTATAVAGSEAGDANQAPNRIRFHCVDQDTSGSGKQARSAKDQLRGRRDAKRLNGRVCTRQRTLDCVLIKRIAIQFLKLGIAQAYCAR